MRPGERPERRESGRTLDAVPLFASLSPDSRARLAAACSWHRFNAHETIIDQADEGRDVYFVVSGKVRVVVYSLSGRELSFSDLGPGGCFGELAAIDGRPRSAAVVALADTMVAGLSGSQFLQVVSETPPLAVAMLTHLAGLVRRSTERIVDLSTLAANNRVHAEVLRLAGLERRGNEAVIRPIPTHSEIAGRVSTTRETVARVFGDLGRMGLVERRSDRLVIRDFARLQAMVTEVRGDG
ncbi:MAG: cyclic nucleotide-binding domain-containing protein [Alphaproteobacteria bacterium]|jgi:CRP-like cAMP-binding protein|nr:cyclic nucleotide-binding domain-containing protein [Alphaproteobacteria bacterium]